MRYGSVCSGVEAASLAWKPLGWDCAFVSEIEPFPSAVLHHHWPDIPNLGDMTHDDFIERAASTGPIDLLVGGTPCQSFSVAGGRRGLDDDRGNLARQFCQIADVLKPRWIVWENVPGVLSSNAGRDFGTFTGALVALGYSLAYRILDAQHFNCAARRQRVFVVGCKGANWRPSTAVLFDCTPSADLQTPGNYSTLEVARTLKGGSYAGCSDQDPLYIESDGVRRATPLEWERMMGMPDNHTHVPWRNNPAEDCPDGPRYKAIGNSMAVPVMRWLGERIDKVDHIADAAPAPRRTRHGYQQRQYKRREY
jgi:DNA (cytosine-5)-methyltransferase 1